MVINEGSIICRYTLTDAGMNVEEGIIDGTGQHMYADFGTGKAPVKFPGYRNIDRVWKDGKTLWLTERNDEEAKRLFTQHYVGLITELQRQIDEAAELVKVIRGSKIRATSKCFGEVREDNVDTAAKPKSKWARSECEGTKECDRKTKTSWKSSDDITPDRYAKQKITTLKKEMYIDLSVEDIRHLKSLESCSAIDAAVRAIINKYWK